MIDKFSKRHGHQPEPEISVREGAPENLRYHIAQFARDAGLRPSDIREVVCANLHTIPNTGNWSDPNIWREVQHSLQDCAWFKVYDIAEALFEKLVPYSEEGIKYKETLNDFFKANGIGWELKDAGIVFRGGPPFTLATTQAISVLRDTGRSRAANEIDEALKDISRRPTPDITGASHPAMAALEATARHILDSRSETVGDLIPKLGLPKPLDIAVIKLWGFASDKARHAREGDKVDYVESELVVIVACAVCTYLAKKSDA